MDEPVADNPTESETGNSRMLGMIAAVGVIAVIVLAEVAVAYLWFPSAEEVAALKRGQQAEKSGQEESEEDVEETIAPAEGTQEIDLGEFNVAIYQPLSNTTLRIDFHLIGIVADEDVPEFQQQLEKNKHRYREQVNITIRSANINDLTDAGLGLIKRKILDKSNGILGKPYLKSIIFSEFSFTEQ